MLAPGFMNSVYCTIDIGIKGLSCDLQTLNLLPHNSLQTTTTQFIDFRFW